LVARSTDTDKLATTEEMPNQGSVIIEVQEINRPTKEVGHSADRRKIDPDTAISMSESGRNSPLTNEPKTKT
jgi:hypothetical protein